MKILIVDDDHISIALLSNYLEESGTCDTAANGEEALHAVQDAMQKGEPYDLICLDILMPNIDGHETLRTIREFEKSTFNVSGKTAKIIMITALNDIETIKTSFKHMCDGYLTKPLNKKELMRQLIDLEDME